MNLNEITTTITANAQPYVDAMKRAGDAVGDFASKHLTGMTSARRQQLEYMAQDRAHFAGLGTKDGDKAVAAIGRDMSKMQTKFAKDGLLNADVGGAFTRVGAAAYMAIHVAQKAVAVEQENINIAMREGAEASAKLLAANARRSDSRINLAQTQPLKEQEASLNAQLVTAQKLLRQQRDGYDLAKKQFEKENAPFDGSRIAGALGIAATEMARSMGVVGDRVGYGKEALEALKREMEASGKTADETSKEVEKLQLTIKNLGPDSDATKGAVNNLTESFRRQAQEYQLDAEGARVLALTLERNLSPAQLKAAEDAAEGARAARKFAAAMAEADAKFKAERQSDIAKGRQFEDLDPIKKYKNELRELDEYLQRTSDQSGYALAVTDLNKRFLQTMSSAAKLNNELRSTQGVLTGGFEGQLALQRQREVYSQPADALRNVKGPQGVQSSEILQALNRIAQNTNPNNQPKTLPLKPANIK